MISKGFRRNIDNGIVYFAASNNFTFDVVYWIKLCYHFMEGGIAWHAHSKIQRDGSVCNWFYCWMSLRSCNNIWLWEFFGQRTFCIAVGYYSLQFVASIWILISLRSILHTGYYIHILGQSVYN